MHAQNKSKELETSGWWSPKHQGTSAIEIYYMACLSKIPLSGLSVVIITKVNVSILTLEAARAVIK